MYNALIGRKPEQWLWLLFYFQVLNLCVGVIAQILTGLDWLIWINRAITALCIFCLLRMAPTNRGYRWSAVCSGVGLIVTLISALFLYPWHLKMVLSNHGISGVTGILVESANLLAMVLSWVAMFLEYRSHGQLIPSLKKSWILLFAISLCLTLLSSLVSWTSVYLVENFAFNVAVINVIAYLSIVINRLLKVAYLWNLYRTAKTFESNTDE